MKAGCWGEDVSTSGLDVSNETTTGAEISEVAWREEAIISAGELITVLTDYLLTAARFLLSFCSEILDSDLHQ